MTRLIALCTVLIAATACTHDAADHDGDPVDGPYIVALSAIHDTCYAVKDGVRAAEPYVDEDYKDASAEIDLFLRPDGSLTMRHSSNWLPGVVEGGRIEGVRRIEGTGGEVDHFRATETEHSAKEVRAIGRITPSTLSLSFTETYKDGHNSCIFTVQADGVRRPIADPEATDGYYTATFSSWRRSCPASRVGEPAETIVGRLDAAETPEGDLSITLNGGALRFIVPSPEDPTDIVFKGEMRGMQPDFFGGYAPIMLVGTAEGAISPDGLDLVLTYATPGDKKGCGNTVHVTGPRFTPSLTAIPNDYRMTFGVSGGCGVPEETRQGTASLIPLGGDAYLLRELGSDTRVTVTDGKLSGSAGSYEADGYEATYDGHAVPPDLSYTAQVRQFDPTTGGECTRSIKALGVVRYVF